MFDQNSIEEIIKRHIGATSSELVKDCEYYSVAYYRKSFVIVLLPNFSIVPVFFVPFRFVLVVMFYFFLPVFVFVNRIPASARQTTTEGGDN